jgi:hypothetical protein
MNQSEQENSVVPPTLPPPPPRRSERPHGQVPKTFLEKDVKIHGNLFLVSRYFKKASLW